MGGPWRATYRERAAAGDRGPNGREKQKLERGLGVERAKARRLATTFVQVVGCRVGQGAKAVSPGSGC